MKPIGSCTCGFDDVPAEYPCVIHQPEKAPAIITAAGPNAIGWHVYVRLPRWMSRLMLRKRHGWRHVWL